MPLKCTAEHLKARSDGGANSARNIVAACEACNRRRHQRKAARSPAEHLEHVQRAMRRGKWHGPWLWENPSLVAVFGNRPDRDHYAVELRATVPGG
nr:HNH endonuclease [Cupriavidus sp. SK-4]